MRREINFELGKRYIVKVTDKGIVPIEEFTDERFFDKDTDELAFLTDEEKAVVALKVLRRVKAEIEKSIKESVEKTSFNGSVFRCGMYESIDIIDRKIKEIKHE